MGRMEEQQHLIMSPLAQLPAVRDAEHEERILGARTDHIQALIRRRAEPVSLALNRFEAFASLIVLHVAPVSMTVAVINAGKGGQGV